MQQARGQELAAWCQATGEWELEVVERAPGTRGGSRVPRRWVVERTFSWISRNRRMSKDYERKVPLLRNAHPGGVDPAAGHSFGAASTNQFPTTRTRA